MRSDVSVPHWYFSVPLPSEPCDHIPDPLGKAMSFISFSQRWSTESYALCTSTHTIHRFLFPQWLAWHTILSINKLTIVPLQFSFTPCCSPCIRLYASRCWSTGFSRQDVNHLQTVFRQVIGLWVSLENSPCFCRRHDFPSANHNGIPRSAFAMAWNTLATPSWREFVFFYQKFTIRSELQLRFLLITFVALSLDS